MEPLHLHGLALGWRPAPVVDLPVVLELAFEFLAFVLDLVEEVWFVVLLPDSHLFANVAQESVLLHSLIAMENCSQPRQLLSDLFLQWRRCYRL